MKFFCNYVSAEFLRVLGNAYVSATGLPLDLEKAMSSGRRVCVGALQSFAALSQASASLPSGAAMPPIDRPRAGFPTEKEGPVWIEFELAPSMDRMAPTMAAPGGRLGALFVPRREGGVAFSAMTMSDGKLAYPLFMPMPIEWSGEGGVAIATVSKDTATAGDIGNLARNAERICGIAIELLRAERMGLLHMGAAPDLSKESAGRIARSKPALLSCQIGQIARSDEDDSPLYHGTIGWCAVCLEGLIDILPVRPILHNPRSIMFDAERVAVARWALGNAEISDAQALACEMEASAPAGGGRRSGLVARIASASGLSLFAIVPGSPLTEIVAYDGFAGDPASDQAMTALSAWVREAFGNGFDGDNKNHATMD